MRPIYRAWDKKYKVMLEGFAIYYGGDHIGMSYDDAKQYFSEEQLENDEGTHFSSGDDWVFILNDFELMQWTGLVDPKGINIFASDIIDDGNGNYAEIIWSQDHCQFLANYEIEQQELGSWCIVAGNIYENPNLHQS